MEKYVINGGNELFGSVEISGAKNAAVAIIAATVLADDVCTIENMPDICDVKAMINILCSMGGEVQYLGPNTVRIDTRNIYSQTVPYELTKKSRSSYYLLGALLGRYKQAAVAVPGGCNFGSVRPIDFHLRGFERLNSKVTLEDGIIYCESTGLRAASIYLEKVSVGATINIMLAAVKARGITVIFNAAREPHIVDVANMLNLMGANVKGAGTDEIRITGVEKLHGCEYSIIPDQIEAGTYMVAVAATGGDVLIKNVIPKHLEAVTVKLRETGASVQEGDDFIRVRSNGRGYACKITASPHPGFPTDMQPQMTAYLSICNGMSKVTDSVWDNRFAYTNDLIRMGADITVTGKDAIISGVRSLSGVQAVVPDLRAGAAMIIAGLVANGTTVLEDIYKIERGYERIIEKFTGIGADIRLVDFPEEENPQVATTA